MKNSIENNLASTTSTAAANSGSAAAINPSERPNGQSPKRIMVIPDVHGRLFWKEPVLKYLDVVDRIVFLGDYLDPYPNEEGMAENILENMMEIIELKRNNMEKVVLLKGNHDQHYASRRFKEMAGGSRMDLLNWANYHEVFAENEDLFQIAHLELVPKAQSPKRPNDQTTKQPNDQTTSLPDDQTTQQPEIPYVFSHAGMTLFWLKKVNDEVWHLPDNQISISDPDIIERINQLDDDGKGQNMLAVVGIRRSWFGEKTGGILWADVDEHATLDTPNAYGMNKVFQVFGHTKLGLGYEKVETDLFAMIDSRQCFIIDGSIKERIVSLDQYEKGRMEVKSEE